MITFSVSGKEYKVKFGYKVLAKENLFKKIIEATNQENGVEFEKIISMVPELLLAGLQKYHKNEFGYITDKEREEKLEIIYDLLDSYEDEGTKDNPHSGYDLYNEMQEELMKNGFLSGIMKTTEKQSETSEK